LILPAIVAEKPEDVERSKPMSQQNNNRVLSRMGARQLTQNELDKIGGAILTRLTAILTAPVTDPDRRLDE
jgi:hypothetical protein